MAVSMSDAIGLLGKQGYSLVPSRGMAEALSKLSGPSANANYEVRGGRGSPYGGLETRVSRSATINAGRDIRGELGDRIGSYIRDPFAYKRKMAETKALSDEAKKFNMTRSEAALLWGNAKSLFSSATDYQTAILSGIFQVMRLQTRYTIAQAKVLGVSSNSLRSPLEDPKRSWFGKMLSSVADDLKKIPGMGLVTSIGKHALNAGKHAFDLASLLNPLTMGGRLMNMKPGAWLQKLIMGKEGYELSKDPLKAQEKAGLKLTDSQRLANLNRAQANYLKEQLNVQVSIFRGVQKIVSVLGESVKMERLDIGHDEYSGELKTNFSLEQDRLRREGALSLVYQKAAQKSLIGRITPFISPFFGKSPVVQKFMSKRRKLTDYDRQVMTELMKGNVFQSLLGSENKVSETFRRVMEQTGGKLDFFARGDAIESALVDFKQAILGYTTGDKRKDKIWADELALAQELASQRESPLQFAYRLNRKLANSVSTLGGGRLIADTSGIGKQQAALEQHSNNIDYLKVRGRSADEEILKTSLTRDLLPKVLRTIPVFGQLLGLEHASQLAKTGRRVESSLFGINDEKPVTATDSIYRNGSMSPSSGPRNVEATVEKQPVDSASVLGFSIPDLGNSLANSVALALSYVIFKLPTQASTEKRSIAALTAAGGVSGGDANGASSSKEELEKKVQEKNKEKEEEKKEQKSQETQDRIATAVEKVAENTEESKKSGSDGDGKKKGKGIIGTMLGGLGKLFANHWGKLLLGGAFFSTGFGKTIAGFGTKALKAIFTYIFGGKDEESGEEKPGIFWPLVGKMFSGMVELEKEMFAANPLATILLNTVVLGKLFTGPIGKLAWGILKIGKFGLGKLFGLIAASKFASSLMSIFGGGAKSAAGEAVAEGAGKAVAKGAGKTSFFGRLIKSMGSAILRLLPGRAGTFAVAGVTGGGLFGGIGAIPGFILGTLAGFAIDGILKLFTGADLFEHITNFGKKIWNWVFGDDGELEKAMKSNEEKIKEAGGKEIEFLEEHWYGDTKHKAVMTPKEYAEYQKLTDDDSRLSFIKDIKKRRESEAKGEKKMGGPEDGTPDYTGGWGAVPVKVFDQAKADQEKAQAEQSQTKNPSSTAAAASAANSASGGEGSDNNSSGGENDYTAGLNMFEKAIVEAIVGMYKFGGGAVHALGQAYNNAFNGGSADISGLNINDLGALSAKFESNGNPATVAYDSGGGTSYGTYQLSSKQGSMKEFLEWCKTNGGEAGKKVYDTMLASVGGNINGFNTGSKSGPPVDAWKQLANSGIIKPLEEEFYAKKFFAPALNKLNYGASKLVRSSFPLQQALFSTAVQHGVGGAGTIFNMAYKDGMDPAGYAQAIYQTRKDRYHGSYRDSVFRRYDQELAIVLSLLKGVGTGGVASGAAPKDSGLWGGAPNITPDLLNKWSVGNEQLVWPTTSNVITSPLGPRNAASYASKWHAGIDIRGSVGQPVTSAMAGKVVRTDPSRWGEVFVEHPNGWVSRYMHMSRIGVKTGDTVAAGQEIGAVGAKHPKASNMAPHLHFEMRKDGVKVDPEGVYYQYGKMGGKTAYDQHSYASDIVRSRQFEAKLHGQYGGVNGNRTDKGAGGPFGDREGGGPEEPTLPGSAKEKTLKMSFEERERLLEEIALKQEEQIRRSQEETKALLAASMAKPQQPAIAISQPAQGAVPSDNGGGNTLATGDSGVDGIIDRMFAKIGNIMSDLNIAHTGLAITTT